MMTECTYFGLVNVPEQMFIIHAPFDEVAPSATQGRVMLVIGHRTLLQTKVCI